MTTVYGLDLSLTASGLAGPDGVACVRPGSLRGPARLARIEETVVAYVPPGSVVAIEGYSMHGTGSAVFGLGEIGGVVRLALWRRGTPHADVPPAVLKTYATGRGNAAKEEVLVAAVRRLGYDGHDHNEADAMWLRALALDAYGSPLVDVPETHRRAIAKVDWPDRSSVL